MSTSPFPRDPPTAALPPVVSFEGIGKSFCGVRVLEGISFSVGPGRIVGLVGENGAGKSTLMNLLGGNLRPDVGEMRVDGRVYAPRDPSDARDAGIAFVHQELNLFPNLSIGENLFLVDFPLVGRSLPPASTSAGQGPGGTAGVSRRGSNPRPRAWLRIPWIDRGALNSRARELLRQVGLDHAPGTPVERLSAGERQLVEIAKAIGAAARVIILDEPTTSLSFPECERLFALMRQLRSRGIALLYISHALGDVLRVCDDLVVLRDGERVGQGLAGEFQHDSLVALMVGRRLNQLYPERSPNRGPMSGGDSSGGSAPDRTTASSPAPVLEVRCVSRPGVVHDISFSMNAGEVLGLAGLMGAGRSELARILFGLDPHASGEIRLQGSRLDGRVRDRIRRGLAFLTEDRRHEGLCLEASIADNMALVTLPRHSRTPARWLDATGIAAAVRRMREAVRLTAGADESRPVRTLSGGNQQKVVLGKWLLAEPRVLILDEPTRGIDVGAKFEIYQLIHRRAELGAGVLVISSEIEELIGICDRILVMRQGGIAGEFHRHEFDRERILAMALHASKR